MQTPAFVFWSTAATVIGFACLANAEEDRVRRLVAEDRPLVIAHRGASAIAPENTLPAFEAALAARADLVELDYVHSADGVPVVLHDDTLDRTTNAVQVLGAKEIRAADRTLADLRRLDAGAWFAAEFAGAELPTLEEALPVIQAGSVTLIERKAGDAATLVRLLKRRDLVESVVVQAFDWDFLAECRRLDDRLVLGALGSEELTDAKLDQIASFAAAAVGWKAADLTPSSIAAARDRGLAVWVYTVNDEDQARRLIADGVTGVITDRPAEIGKAIAVER